MKEQFIPYEQALELKKLGFDEKCMASFKDGEFGWYFYTNSILTKELYKGCHCATAPLWQQAFDWFREKHNLSIQPFAVWDLEDEEIDFIKNKPSFYITDDFIYNENKSIENSDRFKTYEEARLECLKKLIEIIENEQNKN